MTMLTLEVRTTVRDYWSGSLEPATHQYRIDLPQACEIVASLSRQMPMAEALEKAERATTVARLKVELRSLGEDV